MITLTQEDLSRLKTEIEELRKTCAEVNLQTGERGAVPWHIPQDVNAYLTWRYRRVSKKIEDLAKEFGASLDGNRHNLVLCGNHGGTAKSTEPIVGSASNDSRCARVGKRSRSTPRGPPREDKDSVTLLC